MQLLVMMGIRKMLELIFTPIELKILDDALPEFRRKEKLDHEEALEQEASQNQLILKEGSGFTVKSD